MADQNLPFGYNELDPNVVTHPDNPNIVRCFVRGCEHFIHRQTRDRKGELCPDHGIYCHYSRGNATYSYQDVRRNVIASPEQFCNEIIGHPFKYDYTNLGNENSEDTLSWNVFRSLQEANSLAGVAKMLIGEDFVDEPDMFLWGIQVSDDSFEPWDLLILAREFFEDDLPVVRPLTEPDIALHLPGKYLILIEAKFNSPNPYYEPGPRKRDGDLKFDELLDIYQFPGMRLLNVDLARQQKRIHYQLWRNTIFADWMAVQNSPNTKPYHVNLVREGFEKNSESEFLELVQEEYAKHFRRATWEEIYQQEKIGNRHRSLSNYIERKSANLGKAFETNM